MLRDIYTFHLSHDNEVPYMKALLCINNVVARPIPYAWVETIGSPDALTFHPIDHGKVITTEEVHKAIERIIGYEVATDDMDAALLDHMIAIGQEKQAKHALATEKAGLTYKSSHYAYLDAAYAQEPKFKRLGLHILLEAERESLPHHVVTKKLASEKYAQPKTAAWNWKDFKPRVSLSNIVKATAAECALPTLAHKDRNIAERIKRSYSAVRGKTDKARLTQIINLSGELPLTYLGDTPKIRRMLRWLENNPPPLKDKVPEEVAQLDDDSFEDLIAEHLTWLSKWYYIRMIARNQKQHLALTDLVEYEAVGMGEMSGTLLECDFDDMTGENNE